MKSISEIRRDGKQFLSGHWLEAAMLTFIYILVTSGLNVTTNMMLPMTVRGGSSLIVTMLMFPMAWGYGVSFLGNLRGGDDDPFGLHNLIDGYRDGRFWPIFKTYVLVYVYTILWALLLIIPGIIKSLSYSMTGYIMRDHPELSGNAAIEKSMDMMDGHKADLFLMLLFFVLIGIPVCVFTLGLGFFWLAPYVQASLAAFYDDVKADFENRTV